MAFFEVQKGNRYRSSGSPALSWTFCACLAVVLPSLLFYQTTPAPAFSNQDAALLGWGIFLSGVAAAVPSAVYPRGAACLALVAAMLLLLISSLASPLITHAPWALVWPPAGVIACGILALTVGACARRVGLEKPVFHALCSSLVVAGVLNSLIGIVQVFAPGLVDATWISLPVSIGRATGNVRQPNNLSGLLLWSIVAGVWLLESEAIRRPVATGLIGIFLFVVVLTASRTGAISTFVLAVWGALDKRLTRRTRALLIALPFLYGCVWMALAAGASRAHFAFGGVTRFEGPGLAATSRYSVWLDSIALIWSHPWFGVGFGGFNFAWTLTPLSHRPPEGFDHAHNLVLQLAAELGLPCAALVMGLIGYAVWRSSRDASQPEQVPSSSVVRASAAMLGLIALHSMLEYPLWYSSGLLTTAFLAGLCTERRNLKETNSAQVPDTDVTRPLVLAALAMILGAVFAYTDYQRVAAIYAPTSDQRLLAQRITAGRESFLFAYYADYAAATASEDPAAVMAAFPAATHHLLDPTLMMAWANALNERGEIDKARYVARRLQEFDVSETKRFFEPCARANNKIEPQAEASKLPYQCLEPSRPLGYEDLQ